MHKNHVYIKWCLRNAENSGLSSGFFNQPGVSEVCRTYVAPQTLSVYVGKGERPTNDTPLDVVTYNVRKAMGSLTLDLPTGHFLGESWALYQYTHEGLPGVGEEWARIAREFSRCILSKTYQRLTENVRKLSATRIVVSREPSELQAPDFVCVLTRL